MKIAFQGELGAYSHQACLEKFPTAQVLPTQTFEGAFESVKQGQADLAMIPVENSTYGRVADVHHLLPDAGLHIIGEHFLRVRINWLARQGVDKKSISQAISHPVLLGQCRKFMIENDLEWQSWTDTAAAAKHVSIANDDSLSAFSSPLAGELYGLEVLAEHVEDESNNTTRFLVLSPTAEHASQSARVMTSFIFDVRNIPSALYKALGGFATNKVNMTKLESYMIGGKFSATQFYADIQGHPDDENVKLAFEELSFFTQSIKILGVYQMDPARNANL